MSGFEAIKEQLNKMLGNEDGKKIAIMCGAMAFPSQAAIELAHQHEMLLIRDMKLSGLALCDIGFTAMEAADALRDLGNIFLTVEKTIRRPLISFHDKVSTCWHPTYGIECVKLRVNYSAIHTAQAKTSQGHALKYYNRRQNMRRRKFKQFDFYQEVNSG